MVKIDPEIMSGAPCFAGTRVPIQNLIDYLEGGDSIEDFLEGFPSVSREQVIAFLEEAKDRMLAPHLSEGAARRIEPAGSGARWTKPRKG